MARLSFTTDEFDQILQKAQELYPTLGRVYCPYFEDSVHFNAQGLQHLRRQNWNRGRKQRDQFMRLKYLTLAPKILKLSYTLQGVQEGREWERKHKHGRWERHLVQVTYYEFVAVLENRRFKVIVKRVFNSLHTGLIFWSLIPFWRQTERGSRIMSDGNPATD